MIGLSFILALNLGGIIWKLGDIATELRRMNDLKEGEQKQEETK